MHRQMGLLMAAAALTGGAFGCGSHHVSQQEADENTGDVDLALTNSPADVSCLRVTVSGIRTDVRSFSLASNQNASFTLKGLPVGTASIAAEAFEVSCDKLIPGIDPTWYSDAQAIKVSAHETLHVAVLMIHNGRISLGVDFDDKRGPKSPAQPGLVGGTFSSEKRAYLVPVQPGVVIKPILTTGDSPNKKPDGVTPYRMGGLPDGLGAFDNGDGTFTLLSNHEIASATTATRAHGGKGAYVSRWIIRKADLAILHGEDLMQQVVTWNPMTTSYNPPASGASGVTFLRLCSADLPAPSALFDLASGLGYNGRLFFDGEETGSEGRAMAHALDGTSYELPRLGKMSFENSVANPGTGVQTVVGSTDDSTPGLVMFYFGTKTSSGSPVEQAGLTNGILYGVRVPGVPIEDMEAGVPSGPFELFSFGNVENTTGTALRANAGANLVTKWNRPEDSAWDPNNPSDYYFVTTNAINSPSRLWRLHFADVTKPELGGTVEMLLDGSEGQKMFDNITIDQRGHVYLVEDVGGDARLGKVFRYDIATDVLTEIAHSNPIFFDQTTPPGPEFITTDEEASGIIDAQDILGPGWLLLDEQNHKVNADPELVEGGQYMAIFDPGGK